MKNQVAKIGRPRAYSPETLLAKFEEYVEWAKNNPRYIHRPTSAGIEKVPTERPLTLAGFCIFVDIIPDTFREYEKIDEFSGVCARVRARIENDQLEGAMAGQFNPTIAARVLHLADRQEVVSHTVEERVSAMTDDELRAEIQKLKTGSECDAQ